MRRALIVGGGIAGSVAALALQRAGIEPVIYEAYDGAAEDAGFFLNFAANGSDALRAVYFDAATQADGFAIPRMIMWSGTGKRLGEVANGGRLTDGTTSVCLKRSGLQTVLREEVVRRGIQFEVDKRLETAHILPDRVVAGFSDGSEALGDILIGADGIHSRTRRLIDPRAPRPQFTGLVGVGGYSRIESLAPTYRTQHFVFGKRAFFGYLVRENGEIYWFANVAHTETSSAELATVPATEWKQRLLRLFAGDIPLISEIITNQVGDIGAHPVFDLRTCPVWHRGRAVIIGDAAHATSPSAGQGASISCEDAVVLAKCLRDFSDISEAFARYERLRRQRVERVVAYARKLGGNKTPGPAQRAWRDLTLPLILKIFAGEKAHAWMYQHHIEWDEKA